MSVCPFGGLGGVHALSGSLSDSFMSGIVGLVVVTGLVGCPPFGLADVGDFSTRRDFPASHVVQGTVSPCA